MMSCWITPNRPDDGEIPVLALAGQLCPKLDYTRQSQVIFICIIIFFLLSAFISISMLYLSQAKVQESPSYVIPPGKA